MKLRGVQRLLPLFPRRMARRPSLAWMEGMGPPPRVVSPSHTTLSSAATPTSCQPSLTLHLLLSSPFVPPSQDPAPHPPSTAQTVLPFPASFADARRTSTTPCHGRWCRFVASSAQDEKDRRKRRKRVRAGGLRAGTREPDVGSGKVGAVVDVARRRAEGRGVTAGDGGK